MSPRETRLRLARAFLMAETPQVSYETDPDAEPADADAVLDGLAEMLAGDRGRERETHNEPE